MPESKRKSDLKAQKLVIGLCALMAVFPLAKTAIGIYHKDSKAVKAGLLGCGFSGTGLILSVAGYLIDPARKKGRD